MGQVDEETGNGMEKGARGRRRIGWVRLVLLAGCLASALLSTILTAAASADQTRFYSGVSFGPDGAGGSESFVGPESIAVDQASGGVFVYDIGAGKVYKFDDAGHPANFGALGKNILEGVGGAGAGTGANIGSENQVAVAPVGALGGTEGDIYVANNTRVGGVWSGLQIYAADGSKLGELATGGETSGVATDPSGRLFVGVYPKAVEYVPTSNPPVGPPVRTSTVAERTSNVAADGLGNVYEVAFNGGVHRLEGIEAPSATKVDETATTVAVDPVTNELYANQGDQIAVYDSTGSPVYDFASGELSNSYGVAVDHSRKRVYVGDGATVKVFGPALTIPATEGTTAVRGEAAMLHGTVYPEGRQYTSCRFEYGPANVSGFADEAECDPDASHIPADSDPQGVKATLEHLTPDTDYKYRLVAGNALGTLYGETLTFNTVGPPRFHEVLARDAGLHSATLEATIDPRGADTTYRIEWGPTGSYGTVATGGTIGADAGATIVAAHIEGLDPARAYHYRVVASSGEGGEAVSHDQRFETLNSCGFADGRCLELVSRADKGPLASPGMKVPLGAQIQFQAARAGAALAYTVAYGYPEASVGDAAIYLAHRGVGGWGSEQISPPTLGPEISASAGGRNASFKVLSSNLACGVVAGIGSLAAGAPSTVVEAGGANLYRRDNTTGSYEPITHLPPIGPPFPQENPLFSGGLLAGEYQVVGMSPDCRRLVFRTAYRYPGTNVVDSARYQLYEWDHGVIRNVARIPGPGGSGDPVPAESVPGAADERTLSSIGEMTPVDYWHAVSEDGSRTIFTAVSRLGGDTGRRAIFLRDTDDPAVRAGTLAATDISQSETATPNDGRSHYWTASTDGTRIFFTARYGLAANGSSAGATSCANAPDSGEGCDLYEYDADAPAGERLTDLSPDATDPKGAGVVGVLDTSEDGSRVYFAARGRLGGVGRTEAENLEAATYNIYLAHSGAIRFVHLLGESEAVGFKGHALVSSGTWTSPSTADGGMFAFESAVGILGDVPMVYLFSAADGSTICVSCRRDGQAPFAEHSLTPLLNANNLDPENMIIRPTVLTDNGRLYFYSFDPLAPGAIEGDRNLYQWEHGQVSLIATEPRGVPRGAGNPTGSFFAGASADGGDVYFATPQSLLGVDPDERWDVYDARIGGGFPEPVAHRPCDATVEGACNAAVGGHAAAATPATSTFAGPGNPSTADRHRKKVHHKKHRHHRKKHRGKRRRKARRGGKAHRKGGKARRGGDNRRAAR